MLKVTHPETGDEIEVYTPEEIAEKDAAIAKAEEERQKALADLEKERRVSSEKSENIKRLRDMTEEEKSKLTEAEIRAQRIAEEAEEKVRTLKEENENYKKSQSEMKKAELISKFAGGNPDLQEKMKKNWEIVNIEDIEERAKAAAALSGINTNPINPLTQPFYGDAPSFKEAGEKEEFLKSDKANAALNAMGVSTTPGDQK